MRRRRPLQAGRGDVVIGAIHARRFADYVWPESSRDEHRAAAFEPLTLDEREWVLDLEEDRLPARWMCLLQLVEERFGSVSR